MKSKREAFEARRSEMLDGILIQIRHINRSIRSDGMLAIDANRAICGIISIQGTILGALALILTNMEPPAEEDQSLQTDPSTPQEASNSINS